MRLGFMLLGWLTILMVTFGIALPSRASERPNVLLIICDDLNDYVEGFSGHPQAKTPNIARLCRRGVRFTQAHCNIPICGPSRASLFTGVYPHHSGCYGFERWDTYPVLQNSRTLMSHFRANGYQTLGTGKLMHHLNRREWMTFGNAADYGPFAYDGESQVAHPQVPSPYRDIGAIDGSFGPLIPLEGLSTPAGKPLSWRSGSWQKMGTLRVKSSEDRDFTADELNARWVVEQIERLDQQSDESPFFLALGLIRPHTPLIVPQKYFDQFPLDSLQLPTIKPDDVQDTFARTVRQNARAPEPGGQRTADMGTRLYEDLVASYATQELALKHFLQAYLASVASADDAIGQVLDALESSRFRDNTIVVLTSDHGWTMGQKDYLYKNSLWQESTRVPLVICGPGVRGRDAVASHPVGLIDIYPTLIDLCNLDLNTQRNPDGHALDGYSLRPFLEQPDTDQWTGPDEALTAMYQWARQYDPSKQSYSLRSKSWRYIRYHNGKEELYDVERDPNEWNNLAGQPEAQERLEFYRRRLQDRLPGAAEIPPQPKWVPKQKPQLPAKVDPEAEKWKSNYFKRHPAADANGDGELSWPELKSYRIKIGEIKESPMDRNTGDGDR